MTVLLLGALLLSLAAPDAASRSSGIQGVQNGCTCHQATASPEVEITLEGLPSTYVANETYLLTITATGGAAPIEDAQNLGGFNLWISRGTLTNLSEEVQIASANEAMHTLAGNDQRNWTLTWTAPADDTVTAEYRLHVNTVNGDGAPSDEDQWNRKLGATVGANATVAEPVSPLFLYGAPVVMIGLILLVYRRTMRDVPRDEEA